MGKLKFVKEKNINKNFIINHFKSVNLPINKLARNETFDDMKLNMKGKINRREYFSRLKKGWKTSYKHALLFENANHLLKALRCIGAKDCDENVNHEIEHAKNIEDVGMKFAFGIFLDIEKQKSLPFAFPVNAYDFLYNKRASLGEEIEIIVKMGKTKKMSKRDMEIEKELSRLRSDYEKIKKEKGILPEWGF